MSLIVGRAPAVVWYRRCRLLVSNTPATANPQSSPLWCNPQRILHLLFAQEYKKRYASCLVWHQYIGGGFWEPYPPNIQKQLSIAFARGLTTLTMDVQNKKTHFDFQEMRLQHGYFLCAAFGFRGSQMLQCYLFHFVVLWARLVAVCHCHRALGRGLLTQKYMLVFCSCAVGFYGRLSIGCGSGDCSMGLHLDCAKDGRTNGVCSATSSSKSP